MHRRECARARLSQAQRVSHRGIGSRAVEPELIDELCTTLSLSLAEAAGADVGELGAANSPTSQPELARWQCAATAKPLWRTSVEMQAELRVSVEEGACERLLRFRLRLRSLAATLGRDGHHLLRLRWLRHSGRQPRKIISRRVRLRHATRLRGTTSMPMALAYSFYS